MKDIADKLAAIGAPISEEDQIVTLLESLPASYATLVITLEDRVEDVRIDFVISKHFYMRNQSKEARTSQLQMSLP